MATELRRRGAPRTGIIWTSDTLTPTLARFTFRANAAIVASTKALAAEIERWMKEHAPWNDRTGEARATLHTTVEHHGFRQEIFLGHGVEHGYWLEVIQDGRYSIIVPALEHFEGPATWIYYAPVMAAGSGGRIRRG